MTAITNECKCGRPTRDAAYVCDECADLLARSLGDIPWLDEQLEVTVTRQQGIDYRRLGSAKGGKKDAERPLPGNWAASEARGNLRVLLVSWTRMCHEEGVRSSDPRDGLPDDTLIAISRWLLWRVDGLTFHSAGGEAVEEIIDAVTQCHRLIDKPADRQFLGDCSEQECAGSVWARAGGDVATCDTCRTPTKASELRDGLLAELDDRLCTAAEIAELSTYLGLKAGREQVRKYVEYLARKGRIEKHAAFSTAAVYRFGEVYGLLVGRDYGKRAS